jgi:hypothetical protein
VLIAASSAAAQSETASWSTTGLVLGLKAGAGIGAPVSELGETFVAEIELGYALPLPEPVGRSLELFAAGAYLAPSTDGQTSAPDPRLPGDGRLRYALTQQTIALTLGARYRIPLANETIAPYLAAGVRTYMMRTEVEGSVGGEAIEETAETSSAFGLHGALGVDFRLGPGALLAEAQLGYAPIDDYVMRETSVGGLVLLVGYRFMPMAREEPAQSAPVPVSEARTPPSLVDEPKAPAQPAPLEAPPEPAPLAPMEPPAAAPIEAAPAAATPVAGEGTIQGNIRSFDGTPLQATVTVYPLNLKAATNTDGAFELSVKPGRYTVRLRAFGFSSQNRTVIVHENGVTVLNAELRKK